MGMADTVGQSGALPSINYLDMEKIKRETAVYNHNVAVTSTVNMSAPPLISPSSMYSGPPPPYSYPSSTASSVIGGGGVGSGVGHGSHISPPETRRTSDEKETFTTSVRQSLPSINEALNTGDQQPISISSLLTTNAQPQKLALVTKSPTSPVCRSYLGSLPKGPPDSFPHHTTPSAYRLQDSLDRASRPMYSPSVVTTHGESRFATINSTSPSSTYDSYSSSQPSTTKINATINYSRPGASPIQNSPSSSQAYDTAPRSFPSSNAPVGYPTYQPSYTYPETSPCIPSYRRPTASQPAWRGIGSNLERADEVGTAMTKDSPPPRPAYGESVKRHLDIYDLETSLNDIAEVSGRALNFSREYGIRAHQTQRSGPIPGSLPSLTECDEMIRMVQGKMLDSFARIREVVYKQQQAQIEQRNYDQQNYKPTCSEADEDMNYHGDKLEGSGGFAGSDAKKRRGRAAPPGRCHSCNRAETPEWRRGPDGARTLCNACGLHYAKLTRKMGSKAPPGPSNLRPKESSPSSP